MYGVIVVETPECFRCKKTHELEVSSSGYALWQRGVHIQDALPDLSSDEREMLISGTDPECWVALFGEDED